MDLSPRQTILAIDDEAVIRLALTACLEDRGFRALEAPDGRQGLAIIRRERPDLVLVDLRMPDMDGLAVLAAMKAEWPCIPVIVVSGAGVLDEAMEAVRLGAWDFVSKPVAELSLLGHVIDKALEKARLLRENRLHQLHLEQAVQARTRELSEARERLDQQNLFLNTLLESLPNPIFYKDTRGRFLGCNPSMAGMLGLTLPEIIGRTSGELFPAPLAESMERADAELLRSLEPQSFEFELAVPDGQVILDGSAIPDGPGGTVRHFRADKAVFKNRDGAVAGIVGVYADITARKRAEKQAQEREAQLLQADKMISLGIMASGVAHEINNPNNFIGINAPLLKDAWESVLEALDDHFQGDEEAMVGNLPYSRLRQHVPNLTRGIIVGSDRIKTIVRDMKDFLSQKASGMENRVDIGVVLQTSLSMLSNVLAKRTAHLRVVQGQDLPLVFGNPHRLEQVLINLLINAAEALPDRAKAIVVETAFDAGRGLVLVRVRDEGCGIAPQHLPMIFDPFFTTKRESGGTGLGLGISRNIARAHGGDLSFTSRPGQGTTATLELPADREPPVQEV